MVRVNTWIGAVGTFAGLTAFIAVAVEAIPTGGAVGLKVT
jgi:hypothetical protein